MAKAKQATADPVLDAFAKGLTALQRQQWSQASKLLEKAVEEGDRPEIRDRARQLLAVSRQKEAGEAPAANEDPFLRAVFEKNRGDLKAALELSRKGGRDQKDERFAYLVASIHALENRIEEAAQTLNRAIELNPKNRIHAFHDPDFAELRKSKDHRPLFGLS